MKLNDIYIAICTVKLVKVINSIWSSYYQFYTIITCTGTHNLLRRVLKRRYLAVHEGLKQMFTSYPICQFYIFFPLAFWSYCSSWWEAGIATFSVIMQCHSEHKDYLAYSFKYRIPQWWNQTHCIDLRFLLQRLPKVL